MWRQKFVSFPPGMVLAVRVVPLMDMRACSTSVRGWDVLKPWTIDYVIEHRRYNSPEKFTVNVRCQSESTGIILYR